MTSYRPISLPSTISKVFEKLFLKRLKLLTNLPNHQFGFRNQHSTLDRVHKVTSIIERALEEKKYCSTIFLDVAQTFDKVLHEGLSTKLSKKLLGNYCPLIESYLADWSYCVVYEEAVSEYYQVKAGVSQGGVLGPILYLLYTANIPTNKHTTIATYADDTAIMAVGDTQTIATTKLQKALNKVLAWMNKWKIKLNQQKSTHIIYTLRLIDSKFSIYINGQKIQQSNTAKYLGMHLDGRLNWKHHVKKKRNKSDSKLAKCIGY